MIYILDNNNNSSNKNSLAGWHQLLLGYYISKKWLLLAAMDTPTIGKLNQAAGRSRTCLTGLKEFNLHGMQNLARTKLSPATTKGWQTDIIHGSSRASALPLDSETNADLRSTLLLQHHSNETPVQLAPDDGFDESKLSKQLIWMMEKTNRMSPGICWQPSSRPETASLDGLPANRIALPTAQHVPQSLHNNEWQLFPSRTTSSFLRHHKHNILCPLHTRDA